MQGDRVVGWYTAAYTVVGALQIPAWMLAIALGPVFARTHLRDPPAFAATWHEGLRIVTVIALPLALVVCLLAGGVVQELYGRAFARAGDALAILVWSTPILAWNMVVAAALRGARREHLLTAVTGAGAALNVGLNLWAIPRFGMEGAAAVTVATEAAVLLALAASAIRGETVTVPRLPLARIIAALAALAAVTLALDTLTVVLAAAGGLAAYLASLVVTGAVGRADIARVRRAVART
jgi:O-antigen/teichoic acid export membrane protein